MKTSSHYFFTTILLLGLIAFLTACAQVSPEPTMAPAPTGPPPTPRPTVPIVPTSTPSAQAPPAMENVLPVDLTTADDVPIKGDYYRPVVENAPAVLLVHGAGRDRSVWQLFARQLMEQGVATLAIDLRGYGESGGEADNQNKIEDVAAGVDFLAAQAEVDPQNILLIGANDGSWWTLDYASKHPDIKAVALITPGIRYDKKLLGRIMTDYGSRPLFIAVSDNEGNHDENAVKTAKLLDKLATGPHELALLHDYGWGAGLLMQENGLAAKLLAWVQETAGE
jgi:pimeloyl-ACP methyl ester carboxylesterase